jgi:hypothetical protein
MILYTAPYLLKLNNLTLLQFQKAVLSSLSGNVFPHQVTLYNINSVILVNSANQIASMYRIVHAKLSHFCMKYPMIILPFFKMRI